MKRKRLTREGWGLEGFPYWQMELDMAGFRGTAALLRIESGEDCCWTMPRAGRVPVCGAGMMWLQIAPAGRRYLLTVKYRREQEPGAVPRVAVWYADIIHRLEYDPDGVAAFVDEYLDVIFTPQGDLHVDDREELDAALEQGELTPGEHARAVAEGEAIVEELCRDPARTEKWCAAILREVLARLDDPATLRRNMEAPG